MKNFKISSVANETSINPRTIAGSAPIDELLFEDRQYTISELRKEAIKLHSLYLNFLFSHFNECDCVEIGGISVSVENIDGFLSEACERYVYVLDCINKKNVA